MVQLQWPKQPGPFCTFAVVEELGRLRKVLAKEEIPHQEKHRNGTLPCDEGYAHCLRS